MDKLEGKNGPKTAKEWHSDGRVLRNREDYKGAVRSYSKAIELEPTESRHWNSRGIVFSMDGDYRSAIADYSKAIDLEPHTIHYWENRAKAFKKAGEYESAIRDYSKILELNPNSRLSLLITRADLFTKKGDYDGAIRDYSRALELNSSSDGSISWAKEILEKRAWCFAERGAADEALQDYNALLQISQGPKDVSNREKVEEEILRLKEKKGGKKNLDSRDEHYIIWQTISELMKSSAVLPGQDFDSRIDELILKYFPNEIEKDTSDVERINRMVKKELLELRHKNYNGNVEDRIATQISEKIIVAIERNFEDHKYRSEDIKVLFGDILSAIEGELHQRNLDISNENIIQVFSKILEDWSIKPQEMSAQNLIPHIEGHSPQSSSTSLVKDMDIEEFFKKMQELKDTTSTTSTTQLQIAENMEIDLNFSLINVNFKLGVTELIHALYSIFKKRIFGETE